MIRSLLDTRWRDLVRQHMRGICAHGRVNKNESCSEVVEAAARLAGAVADQQESVFEGERRGWARQVKLLTDFARRLYALEYPGDQQFLEADFNLKMAEALKTDTERPCLCACCSFENHDAHGVCGHPCSAPGEERRCAWSIGNRVCGGSLADHGPISMYGHSFVAPTSTVSVKCPWCEYVFDRKAPVHFIWWVQHAESCPLHGLLKQSGSVTALAKLEHFIAGEQYAFATYLGGYKDRAEIDIFHHGMATVFNMLRTLVKTDGDTR